MLTPDWDDVGLSPDTKQVLIAAVYVALKGWIKNEVSDLARCIYGPDRDVSEIQSIEDRLRRLDELGNVVGKSFLLDAVHEYKQTSGSKAQTLDSLLQEYCASEINKSFSAKV